MEELWYKDISYEDAKDLVKENLANTVSAFIAAGYWLKCIRDGDSYVNDGYRNIWECAEKEFGLKISEASRAMSMNDKYSVDGNSPFIDDIYRQYNKSQLQEMLTMSDEQIELVTPHMTVRDIREIKNSESENSKTSKQENLEGWVYSFVYCEYMKLIKLFQDVDGISVRKLKETYGEKLCSDDLSEFLVFSDEYAEHVNELTGEIIGKYDLNMVIDAVNGKILEMREIRVQKMKPEIRGLNFPYCSICFTKLRSPVGGNADRECRWCGQGVDWSEYIDKFCDVAMETSDSGEGVDEDFVTEIEVIPEAEESLNIEFDTNELMQEIDDVVDGEYREVLEEKSVYRFAKTEYPEGSLLTTEETVEPVQLGLSQFKNNEQRKAWIEDVEAWGLWYEDANIQARYYKYDFPDGSRLIAVKYRYTCPPWMLKEECFKENQEADGDYKDTHYHMIYSDEYRKNQHKNPYVPYERFYTNSTVSVSILVEYLKHLQKKEG